jgi:LacI family transcriptional regulator
MAESGARRGARATGRVTIRDVARAVGVTPSTVSLALSGRKPISTATREAIEKAIHELGYVPNPHATRLARGHTPDLVSLVSLMVDFGVGTWLLQELQKKLHAQGLRAPIHGFSYHSVEHPQDQIALMRDLCEQRPRAILCTATGIHTEALAELDAFRLSGGITVCTGYGVPVSLPCDQVIYDEYPTAVEATRYLLRHGHRRIGIFHAGRFVFKNRRWEGWRDTLLEAGIVPPDSWSMAGGGIEGNEAGGLWLAEHLAAWPVETRPTAMLLINDHSAVTFMAAAKTRGLRVPEDISVIGWDNLPIAPYGCVPLTTMAHPVLEIAEAVLTRLQARLDGATEPAQVFYIPGRLVERESVALLS